MPELPEVETVMRGLEPAFLGARFDRVEQRRADLRFPLPENMPGRLEGRQVRTLDRRSKYILAHLDDSNVLVLHLGMSGRIVIDRARRNVLPGKHDHVIFHMSNGQVVAFNDARRFGSMALISEAHLADHSMFKNLGPEPLGAGFTPEYLAGRAMTRNVDLKTLLMDQRIVAGLGNIYVCEALFRAGLSPRRRASSLARKDGSPGLRAVRLVTAIREVLKSAIEAGGSTLRDHRQVDGSLGYFQHSFSVYGRDGEHCANQDCTRRVRRIRQSGRSSFFCGRCQN